MSATSPSSIDAATILAFIHNECTDETKRAEVRSLFAQRPDFFEAINNRFQSNAEDGADLSLREIETIMAEYEVDSVAHSPAQPSDKDILQKVRDGLASINAPQTNTPGTSPGLKEKLANRPTPVDAGPSTGPALPTRG